MVAACSLQPSRGASMARARLPRVLPRGRNLSLYSQRSPTRLAMSSDLEALLQEHRKFDPPDAFRAGALLSDPDVYTRAASDPEAYWAEQAPMLEWIKPYDRVLDWKPPHAQWFVGGTINASVNCLDRHIRTPR